MDEGASGGFEFKLVFEAENEVEVNFLQPEIIIAVVDVESRIVFVRLFLYQHNIFIILQILLEVDIVHQTD